MEKFETVLQLKQKLINTLSSHVPPLSVIDTFNVGYFHGRPRTKSWMVATGNNMTMVNTRFGNDKEQIMPMIRGKAGCKRKTDVVDTLATAAVAIISALQPKSPVATIAHASTVDGMSPGKKVRLLSQYLNQFNTYSTIVAHV